MKVLHLSTTDIQGGASRGSYSLHKTLLKSGVDSLMLVATKKSDDRTVISPNTPTQRFFNQVKSTIDRSVLNQYKNRIPIPFSAPWIANLVDKETIYKIKPDIIHLHWVCGGFIRPEILRNFADTPIVWTLRDMWTFTGGCHYSQNCDKYQDNCGACPVLGSKVENDISRKVWKQKQKSWQKINLTIVGISNWIADCARRSSLLKDRRIEVVSNALDERIYKPTSKNIAREILNIDQNKHIILFGALNAVKDTRKGFQYLLPALRKLSDQGLGETTELIIFGSSEPREPPNFGMKAHYMGILHDDITIALAYCAADVMLTPSLEEAFGKTAMESLACGTPVVCFDSTGLKDIVDHKVNGYRAKCFSSDDLAEGISWVLEDKVRWQILSQKGREKVEQEFTLDLHAKNYINIYQSLLD